MVNLHFYEFSCIFFFYKIILNTLSCLIADYYVSVSILLSTNKLRYFKTNFIFTFNLSKHNTKRVRVQYKTMVTDESELSTEIVSPLRNNSDQLGDVSGNPANTSSSITPSKLSTNKQQQNLVNVTARASRRRQEAVRRLVADVQARPDRKLASNSGIGVGVTGDGTTKESQDWIIASTVAASLERGLDRELHHELVQEAKENSGRIGQVCHDHSDVFLASVGKVVALGNPSSDLASKLSTAQDELEQKTSGPMQQAAMLWEEATASHARARALYIMVQEFHKVAIYLEKARKQAALGRPRGALGKYILTGE
jgi:hypothetical protein